MGRKTIDVDQIKKMVNDRIRISPPEAKWERIALHSLLTTILHDTGNYRGFNYIDWRDGGYDKWVQDGEPDDKARYLGDQTKTFFY
jgi:hypothetical protein